MPNLTLPDLQHALANAVALRVTQRLQPAGGPGSKVFPPTYGPAQDGKDGDRFGETKYATETRRIDGAEVPCVLLDSVASQANRMELALLEGWEDDALPFPLVRVDFSGAQLDDAVGTISALEAPHRIYDAILRDSVDASGTLFRFTEAGTAITHASTRDAGALYRLCPTALVFGAWDSTGPKGGLGSKFPRALSAEIVGVGASLGARVGSRIDPLQITKVSDVIVKHEGPEVWDIKAQAKAGKPAVPSDINHGNVTPTRDVTNGGVTLDHARQTVVLSLPALRRLRFPTDAAGQPHADRAGAEQAARTALAALAVAGLARANAAGHDLRSGTLLVPEGPMSLEIVGADGAVTGSFHVGVDAADALLRDAERAAAAAGMGWAREPIPTLRPAPKLVHLLRESQAAAAKAAPGEKVDA